MQAPASVPTCLLITGIDKEAVQPELEALGIAQPRELAPGKDERLLDGVLCPLDVPEDPVRDRVAAITIEVDELGEGALVALPSTLDRTSPAWVPSTAPDRGRFTH